MGKAIGEQERQAIIERNMGRFGAAGITAEAIGWLVGIAESHGLNPRQAQYHISVSLMARTGIMDTIPQKAVGELDDGILGEMAEEVGGDGNAYFLLG